MIGKNFDRALKKGLKLKLTETSKFILFSDCHRGDNSYADDFVSNSDIYMHALQSYFNAGYTYVELGDGIELWENSNFSDIFNTYQHIFFLLKDFYDRNRLHMIWGNHDMVFKSAKQCEKLLGRYFDQVMMVYRPLMPGLRYQESLHLYSEKHNESLLLLHGHQADPFNYSFWKISRFLVRYLWKPLQILGVKDPTSPAKNFKELLRLEKRIKRWILRNNRQAVIAGHTHRPRFPSKSELPYFNCGSCVHPRAITGLEINGLEISLVKWHKKTNDSGITMIEKQVLEGPEHLISYWSSDEKSASN